jgi:tRNA dimethylallyltransferase
MTDRAAKRAVLIAGPTASGKSALALMLAEALGGTIINADAMQVYRVCVSSRRARRRRRKRGCRICFTAMWTRPRTIRSAAGASTPVPRWQRSSGGGRLPRGLAAVPPIPAQVRSAVRAQLAGEGIAALYAELSERDGATAGRLMPGDHARITRALEVVLATGRSLTDWHREGMPPALDPQLAVKVFLDVDRAELYRRIDARFDAMLTAGAREEVGALASRRLDPALPAMKAHGVPWLSREYCDGRPGRKPTPKWAYAC